MQCVLTFVLPRNFQNEKANARKSQILHIKHLPSPDMVTAANLYIHS